MIDTNIGAQVSEEMLANYFTYLVNHFYKILPMRENEEETLGVYMQSLQVELLGAKSLMTEFGKDPEFLVLTAILQWLIKHPNCSVKTVKREVFKAINVCEKMRDRYKKAVQE